MLRCHYGHVDILETSCLGFLSRSMKLHQQKVQNISDHKFGETTEVCKGKNQRIPVRAAQELRLRAPEQRKLKSEKLAAEFKSAYSWSIWAQRNMLHKHVA